MSQLVTSPDVPRVLLHNPNISTFSISKTPHPPLNYKDSFEFHMRPKSPHISFNQKLQQKALRNTQNFERKNENLINFSKNNLNQNLSGMIRTDIYKDQDPILRSQVINDQYSILQKSVQHNKSRFYNDDTGSAFIVGMFDLSKTVKKDFQPQKLVKTPFSSTLKSQNETFYSAPNFKSNAFGIKKKVSGTNQGHQQDILTNIDYPQRNYDITQNHHFKYGNYMIDDSNLFKRTYNDPKFDNFNLYTKYAGLDKEQQIINNGNQIQQSSPFFTDNNNQRYYDVKQYDSVYRTLPQKDRNYDMYIPPKKFSEIENQRSQLFDKMKSAKQYKNYNNSQMYNMSQIVKNNSRNQTLTENFNSTVNQHQISQIKSRILIGRNDQFRGTKSQLLPYDWKEIEQNMTEEERRDFQYHQKNQEVCKPIFVDNDPNAQNEQVIEIFTLKKKLMSNMKSENDSKGKNMSTFFSFLRNQNKGKTQPAVQNFQKTEADTYKPTIILPKKYNTPFEYSKPKTQQQEQQIVLQSKQTELQSLNQSQVNQQIPPGPPPQKQEPVQSEKKEESKSQTIQKQPSEKIVEKPVEKVLIPYLADPLQLKITILQLINVPTDKKIKITARLFKNQKIFKEKMVKGWEKNTNNVYKSKKPSNIAEINQETVIKIEQKVMYYDSTIDVIYFFIDVHYVSKQEDYPNDDNKIGWTFHKILNNQQKINEGEFTLNLLQTPFQFPGACEPNEFEPIKENVQVKFKYEPIYSYK